ncbi:MAG: PHP domain-containing protein [Clostridiales bacterium]|nr:PHP domain-containing protein [Clostridiales bacterium]
MRADLHCHTTISDGSLGISDVIQQAVRNEVDYLAITDHDTLASLARSAVLGKRYGVNIVPAVELSSYDSKRGRKAHILCYMPEKPDRLEGLCYRTTEYRKNRGKSMAFKVMKKFPITLENIMKYASSSKAIYRCHIMHALMEYGYTTELYGNLYDEIFNPKDGLCKEEVSSEEKDYPEVSFVIELIHAARGVAVLAHPKVYDSFDLLVELAQNKKIDGVEVWHRSIDDSGEKKLLEISKEYDIITTGGSDFHGYYNHYPVQIGSRLTPQNSLDRILNFNNT